ncbi:MAG: M28 family peptidase [Crocinitomicaceae bacterium]
MWGQKKGENKQENSAETPLSADSLLVQKVQSHVNVLCNTSRPRNHENIEILDSVATYIFHQFEAYCDTVYYQTFEVNKKTYKNVIGVLNANAFELVVIGAHYDVCGATPGADDNASGISGLIESGRLLSEKEIKNRIELVAFTLEEPPYFRTENMGSYHYANKLKKEKADLKYMVCLEMIGYYDENKNTQEYPVDAMKHQYGTQANFLAIVENEKQGNVGKELFDKLKSQSSIKYEYVQAPSFMTGVDFSDHLSFWKLGLKAFMITDTSFYRNKHYHEDSDKPELLDYNKIALFVVDFVNSF